MRRATILTALIALALTAAPAEARRPCDAFGAQQAVWYQTVQGVGCHTAHSLARRWLNEQLRRINAAGGEFRRTVTLRPWVCRLRMRQGDPNPYGSIRCYARSGRLYVHFFAGP